MIDHLETTRMARVRQLASIFRARYAPYMGALLGEEFFARDGTRVARELLGAYLCVERDGKIERRMITETESYHGRDDKASHASRGKTARNSVMFGPPGHWYVYLIYGMYEMLNIVTGKDGEPSAVLIRGVEGLSGPGKLTTRLRITRAVNGKAACPEAGVWMEARDVAPGPRRILATPRVGVSYAGEWAEKKLRFVLQE